MDFFKRIVRFFRNLLLGANIVTALMLLASAYSSYVHPEKFSPVVPLSLAFPAFVIANVGFLVFWLLFRLRYALVSFLALALSAVQIYTYCPFFSISPHPKGSIGVLSYNVMGFGIVEWHHPENNYLEDFLSLFSSTDADIVCLQEYTTCPATHPIDSILQHRWPHRSVDQLRSGDHVAIFSRYPIVGKCSYSADAATGAGMVYHLLFGKDTLIVVNNHLASNRISANDKSLYKTLIKKPKEADITSDTRYFMRKLGTSGAERARQADALCAYLDSLPSHPTIICGDLNDSPISYVHRRITEAYNDAYTRAGNGPGISYHESGMFFRIDHLFCSPDLKPYDAVVDSRFKTSDHYPISAYFQWPGKTAR